MCSSDASQIESRFAGHWNQTLFPLVMLQRAVSRALSFLLCTRTVQQRTIESRAAAEHFQPPRQLFKDVLESSSKR